MGRLAILAAQQEVDKETVFTYSITIIHLFFLFSTDGSMAKTDKSTLFQSLEELKSYSNQPTQLFASVIDGNFLLHTLVEQNIATYGVLQEQLL